MQSQLLVIDRTKKIVWIATLVVLSLLAANTIAAALLSAIVALVILPSFVNFETGEQVRGTGFRLVIAFLLTALVAFIAYKNASDIFSNGMAEAESAVSGQLRDPSSAQFRNWRKSDKAVCGEVNGRNGFGGYSGFKKFVYESGSVTFEPIHPFGESIEGLTAYYSASADFARKSRKCYG